MKKQGILRWIATGVIILILFGGLGVYFIMTRQGQSELDVSSTTVQEPSYTLTGFLMDTEITQTLYGNKKKEAAQANMEFLEQLNQKFSPYQSDSEVSKINLKAGLTEMQMVQVSNETFQLIKKAKEYGEKTNGLFDVTIGPLTSLWGIGSDHPKVPSQEEIDKAMGYIDYKQIKLDEKKKAVRLQKPYMSLDLGGIAKGYVCDLLKKKLEEQQITSGTISLGGNVMTVGKKPDQTQFQVGIRNPFGGAQDYFGVLSSQDEIMATTGTYERNFTQNGKLYHHILDPRTGYPCESDLESVTVISQNGALADALSTTLFLAGKEKALTCLNREEFSLILVDKDKKVYLSDSLKDRFQLEEGKGFSIAEVD